MSELKYPHKAPVEFDKFTTKGNTVRLMIYNDDNGKISLKKKVKLKHKPLLCCPHCGGVARIEYKKAYGGVLKGFAVRCKKCYCSSSTQFEGDTVSFGETPTKHWTFADALNYVVDKWNARCEVAANA